MNDRQELILRMLASGKRDKEIADALHLCQETVRQVIKRAVVGLGAKTRCEAVAIFVRHLDDDGYV